MPQGCDVAVFPEFSLTGSVDPRRHPERSLTVDAEPVRQAARRQPWRDRRGRRSSASPSASMGHSTSPRFTATPAGSTASTASATSARTSSGYRTGETAGVFQLGSAKFGVTICAEGEVDFPWDEAVAGGAEVVFFCSAPGLYRAAHRRSTAGATGTPGGFSNGLGHDGPPRPPAGRAGRNGNPGWIDRR